MIPVPARTTVPLAGLALALAAGALLPGYPLAVAALALLLGSLLIAAIGDSVLRLYGGAMAVILAGYAFFDRSFAYVGIPPVFVGEVGLFFSAVIFARGIGKRSLGLIDLLIIAYVSLGLVRTLPYLSQYGVFALRDGVIWAYAIFALAVSSLDGRRALTTVLALYRRFLPWWVVLAAPLLATSVALRGVLPLMPGSEVNVLFIRQQEVAVHLAGVAAFVLTGLATGHRGNPVKEALLWIPWLAAAAMAVAFTRGGALALFAGLVVVAGFLWVDHRSAARLGRVIRLAAVTAVFGVAFLALAPSLKLEGRAVSSNQILDNVVSIFSGGSDDEVLQVTKNWRLEWWESVAGYTFGGPYFWAGKGFGVNLADSDGFQVDPINHSLRSPHNSHVTILARMGVPGFALWTVLQVAFGLGLVRASAAFRRAGNREFSAAAVWVLAYWTAMMVDTSFELYLEGPQGGIWYWSVFGIGMLLIAEARRLSVHPSPEGATGARPPGS